MKKTLLSILFLTAFNLTGCSSLSGLIEKPDSEKTVEEFYKTANIAFEEQRWDAAIKEFEKLKSYFPYGPYAEQSYLSLAYSYYKFDEYESAIFELDEFIRIFPKHQALDYAYYLRALAADEVTQSWLDSFLTDPATRDTESTLRAFEFYNQLLERFPESQYADKAGERLIVLRNQMARSEYHVAQYYFKRQAYLAAANRGKYILKHYPQSSVTEDTLLLLERSYAKLNMPEVMKDIRSVYELNHTSLSQPAQAVGIDNRSLWQRFTSIFN